MILIEAISAFQTIQTLINDPRPKSVDFSYALLRNRRELAPVVQRYNERLSEHQDPDLEAMLAEWRTIAPSYAQFDGENPVLDENGSVMIAPDKLVDYNLACEQIMMNKAEYKVAFDIRADLIRQLQNEEVAVKLHPIKISDLPSETDIGTIDLLWPLLEPRS